MAARRGCLCFLTPGPGDAGLCSLKPGLKPLPRFVQARPSRLIGVAFKKIVLRLRLRWLKNSGCERVSFESFLIVQGKYVCRDCESVVVGRASCLTGDQCGVPKGTPGLRPAFPSVRCVFTPRRDFATLTRALTGANLSTFLLRPES